MLLEEYPDLVPIGGSGDRGRDAEAVLREALDGQGRRVVFQYSYQKTWQQKLRTELQKIKDKKLDPVRYVFVTNQRVADQQRTNLTKWVRDEYGWDLELYDQEWLRARLESAPSCGAAFAVRVRLRARRYGASPRGPD